MPPSLMSPSLVILDADGTLRRCTVAGQVCPNRSGEWELLPGVRERLAAAAAEGTRFAVASNQGGVALGLLTTVVARRLLEETAAAAFPSPGEVRIFMCPHASKAGCSCRKPAPGMLLEAMRWAKVEPARVLMVGDMESDRGAAAAAGVAFLWAWDYFGFPAPRPVPAQRAPDVAQHREILIELLEVERARLKEALRIERERSMVFPETTVIVKDVQRLAAAVYGPAGASVELPATGETATTTPATTATLDTPATSAAASTATPAAAAGAAPGDDLDGLDDDGDELAGLLDELGEDLDVEGEP